MARVTPIRESGQTEYRLRPQCSADHTRQADAPVEYRLAPGDRPIERIGNGWRSLNRTPGAPLGVDELGEVRAIMSGADPRTGEQVIRRKTRVAKAAKLPAFPLLKEIHRQGAKVPADSWAERRLARAIRATQRDHGHTAPVKDLERLARAADIDPATVWPETDLKHAKDHAHEREEIGVRGWDLTLDSPKSVSVLWALADDDTARRIEESYLAAVRQTIDQVEEWTARGQRGQHGNGRVARRVKTSGLIGSMTLHTTARPVEGTADPHLHAHVMLANLALGEDGQWGAVGAGGRELYEHVPAIGELMRANLREHLARDVGVSWFEESPGRWEISGVGPQVRDLYSRRRDQAIKEAGKESSPAQRRLAARRSAADKDTGQGNRTEWIERAHGAKVNPEQLVNLALGRDPVEVQEDEHEQADRLAARVWAAHPTGSISHPRLLAYATQSQANTTLASASRLAAKVAATGQRQGHARGGSTRYAAPPVSEHQARTGQGPAARATAHTIAALQARQALHEQRATSAEAARSALVEATHRHWPAWRQGTTRGRARALAQQHQDTAAQARSEAARIAARIARVHLAAVEQDLDTATAQTKARQALQAAQAQARWREVARSQARPRPRRPQQPSVAPSVKPTLTPFTRARRPPTPPQRKADGPGFGR